MSPGGTATGWPDARMDGAWCIAVAWATRAAPESGRYDHDARERAILAAWLTTVHGTRLSTTR
jgi:hypothetical protein